MNNELREKIKDILGVEIDPDGNENMYLIRDEHNNLLQGIDFTDEINQLCELFNKKCPYPDCPKVKYKDCAIHGV